MKFNKLLKLKKINKIILKIKAIQYNKETEVL